VARPNDVSALRSSRDFYFALTSPVVNGVLSGVRARRYVVTRATGSGARSDRLARNPGLKRDELIERGLRTVLAALGKNPSG